MADLIDNTTEGINNHLPLHTQSTLDGANKPHHHNHHHHDDNLNESEKRHRDLLEAVETMQQISDFKHLKSRLNIMSE